MTTQASSVKEFLEGFDKEKERIAQALPDANRIFKNLLESTRKDGALSARVKELIAVGIAVADGCERCIMLRTNRALELGATPEEISEAASVALCMKGGKAFVHVPIALRAAEELREKH